MPTERKPPRDAMSQRHVSNFVRALGDTVPQGSRDAALYALAADDYGRASNGRTLDMDLLNPALYASIAATLGSNWLAPDAGQAFVDQLIRGLPSESFLEAAGGRTPAPGRVDAPRPAPSPVPQRIGPRSPPSPFLTQVQGGRSDVPRARYSRRLDAPPRRLTEEEQRAENRRLYGNPDGPPDPSSRRTRGVPEDPISRRRRAQSEEITIPRRQLPREGPER